MTVILFLKLRMVLCVSYALGIDLITSTIPIAPFISEWSNRLEVHYILAN
jgi:hypothetical protein